MEMNPVLQYVKEVKELSDIKKVAQLLSTGEWIAINATWKANEIIFSLGKIQLI